MLEVSGDQKVLNLYCKNGYGWLLTQNQVPGKS